MNRDKMGPGTKDQGPRTASPAELALARELCEVGLQEQQRQTPGECYATTWEKLDPVLRPAWIAIARHVLQSRPWDRPGMAALMARAKSREFFEDGLSADLHELGIDTIPAAYARGHQDAVNEITAELAEKGRVQS